jgi:predicted porin
MRGTRLWLAAGLSAATLLMLPRAAYAISQEEILKRLDALEQKNDRLARENAELRQRVLHVESGRAPVPVAAAVDPKTYKGNPVLHAGVALSPAPAPLLTIAGTPLITKGERPLNPLVDNTTVTLYGHVDASVMGFNVGVYDQGNKWAIGSNSSYFGVRARHNLEPYGYPGWALVSQYESLVDMSSVPTERAALGTRDSYIGVEGPYGAIKIGKGDTPYKKSTAAFDPFANTVGDYNSIMGNTGGDIRAEFDWRAPHAIWYESPIWSGFQATAMVSPGQNPAFDNSAFAYGDFNCPATSARGSGSGFPNGTQGFNLLPNSGAGTPLFPGNEICNDGSYGDLYSAALTYKNGPFTVIAAAELHRGVNRNGDEFNADATRIGLPNGQTVFGVGVANEWAAKVGAGYRIDQIPWGALQLYAAYEVLRRENTNPLFNERSRNGVFASATQNFGPHWSVSASYAHAWSSPGSPGTGVPNNFTSADALTQMPAALNGFSSSADMYAVGTRYRFNQWASWYLVGSYLRNAPGAHYCLGVSGPAFALCGRDQFNQVVLGTHIRAVSSGLTLDF